MDNGFLKTMAIFDLWRSDQLSILDVILEKNAVNDGFNLSPNDSYIVMTSRT